MLTTLLIAHMLVAVLLIGALTHQTLAAWWPVPAGPRSFFANFRAVRAGSYTKAIVILYALDVVMGALLYPDYRVEVRTFLEQLRLKAANGSFEIKEHLAAIGLGMLPVYWLVWTSKLEEYGSARKAITLVLAFTVWWNFIVGHLLTNIRGFGL
ncbi:MAG: hypothetical protein ACM30I_07830 [Gemmatimonas sp.]